MASIQHVWHDSSAAVAYVNAENATRPSARLLVSKSKLTSAVSASEDVYVFDLATGTGAAVHEIYAAVPKEHWGNLRILGGDVSEPMLEYLGATGKREGWRRLETRVVDGKAMNFEPETFTHALCTFGVFVMPACLPSLYSALKKGGFVGITTWKTLMWMPMYAQCMEGIPEAQGVPSPAQIEQSMYSGLAWDEPEFVAKQLRDAGFGSVDTEVARYRARVGSPEAFMQTMQFPLKLVQTFWPQEKRDEWLGRLNELLLVEVKKLTVEDGTVEMGFEAICAWGWKE